MREEYESKRKSTITKTVAVTRKSVAHALKNIGIDFTKIEGKAPLMSIEENSDKESSNLDMSDPKVKSKNYSDSSVGGLSDRNMPDNGNIRYENTQ